MDNINEYEKQRLENIRRNQEKLKELNLLSASLLFEDLSKEKNKKRKRTYEKKKTKEVKPVYKRITRNQAKLLNINVNNKEEVMKQDVKIKKEIEEEGKLIPAEEYFPEEVKNKAIIVDGHFNGWINPELIEKYHFEKSAKEAWDNNGGGKYSHKNPLGEFKETIKSVKPRNWSAAKYVASKLFQKNPNAYFYRHLEPGLTQNIGDWDDEEKELFIKIAKEFGCGDKWGIFSSYIPKRVGYQCANYYRQVIIPEGLIFDPNYKFSKWGKAIYCGSYNSKTKKNRKSDKNNDKENNNNSNNKQKKELRNTNDNEQIKYTNNNNQIKYTNNNEQIKKNNSKINETVEIMNNDHRPKNHKYSLRKRKPKL
ncbi:hypothetical protein BCR32DRAFT_326702 [Anaeromyces robustus]|uniref:Myb-like domain-containing protein n=1 Tax=Anaeromyces robustus TaxID=1754192 RepID=A0A1Y1XAL0_9FUNG|nr:hypothetical protein BCR32DRAFT_326702 [Anaeromyces robustus]|eukprot:ORX82778.1 hypothetical protein BCR32DRAFT_326702 [Anaeromyces robustus]